MTSEQATRQIVKKGPPKRRRASHGQWVDPARAVYDLVTGQKWNVSDAVREVVAKFAFKDRDAAFNGVRAAYYVLRTRKAPVEGFDI